MELLVCGVAFKSASKLGNILTEKGIMRAWRGHNNMDHMDEHFWFYSIFKQYQDY